MSILVADDSDVVRSVVTKALNLYGYKDIIEASNGGEALNKAKLNNSNIELYILDINMPGINGITLTGELRKINRSVPIIILTTESEKLKMIKAKEKGATGWVIKPFESDKFIKIVDMLIKK
jgi:two-component system chemotaxis response regulator CheY